MVKVSSEALMVTVQEMVEALEMVEVRNGEDVPPSMVPLSAAKIRVAVVVAGEGKSKWSAYTAR
jgi:hypothetical protein